MPVLSDDDRLAVEDLVLRYAGTPSRRFPALRESGEVPLELLKRGALDHPTGRIRWRCLDLLDHLGDETVNDVFEQALLDPLPRVRRHAAHALECTKCRPT